ncbi:Techylectin-5A like protein [Argiope bruennichi]|uniref:Techylectin-5A like protein n=1 Tax=Argiope bruennichi TaxID=94029 RepID=A0A8T0ENX4_ARGBR|nr:Techylectin-5A like protein [Argiope bruennichi]
MKFAFFSVLLLISCNLSKSAINEDARVENAEEGDCKCPKKHEKPMDCAEVLENGNAKSGVYTIWPRSRLAECSSIEVFCDMVTDGGGWIVIQRRCQYGNGEDYFVKNWNEYKNGFGNIKKEFWLGNDNIHSLTNQGQYSVRFDMRDENRTSVFAIYENFWIGNEESKYRIHLSEYSGTAGK